MRIWAGIVVGLVATTLAVNLPQVSRFSNEWRRTTCGHADWCWTTTSWGLRATLVVTGALVVALLVGALAFEPDPHVVRLKTDFHYEPKLSSESDPS